jgi:hypothetical protein
MSMEAKQLPSGAYTPQTGRAIGSAAQQPFSIGAESYAENRKAMTPIDP